LLREVFDISYYGLLSDRVAYARAVGHGNILWSTLLPTRSETSIDMLVDALNAFMVAIGHLASLGCADAGDTSLRFIGIGSDSASCVIGDWAVTTTFQGLGSLSFTSDGTILGT
jgi:hypothetical protein